MSSNAIRGPRRAAQTGAGGVIGLAGERASTPTPSSGIRSAPLGPSDATPAVGVAAANAGKMHASADAGESDSTGSGARRRYDKVDIGRLQFDSGEMTHVAAPNPMLLAIARGERAKAPRRLTWFALGMTVGAVAVWFATSDVRGDIFAARVHVASILRSLRGADDPPPATLVTDANDAAGDPFAHAAAVAKTDAPKLPPASGPSATPPSAIVNPPATVPPLGTPVLANAPGPR